MNLKQKLLKKLKKSGGFTLIEMLIVVAIIAILVAISIPVVNSSLDKAKKATDEANDRAAKAAAVIKYMTEDPQNPLDNSAAAYYYDAAAGELKEKNDGEKKPYGQTKEHKNQIVWVTIKEDGTVTTEWK